jgi:hypothetical protein
VFGALNRANSKIEFIQARHEEMAAFMASAYAKFSGELGVCIATSGPGASHLVTGLYDARLDHMPVLAITGQQARTAIGGHYQQEVDARQQKHFVRDVVYACAAATAFAGLGFHLYNILKRPGGWSWLNLFYSAPIGAPMALALAGLLGRGAERVRHTPALARANVLGLPAGRMLAGLTAAGLAGTVGEAGLLHFRGAYHNPAMFIPVSVPPLASLLVGAAALQPSCLRNRVARWWLWVTAFLGFAGGAIGARTS